MALHVTGGGSVGQPLVRDWFTATAWPARGSEPGPRLWIGPASVGQPPAIAVGDLYDAVQGV